MLRELGEQTVLHQRIVSAADLRVGLRFAAVVEIRDDQRAVGHARLHKLSVDQVMLALFAHKIAVAQLNGDSDALSPLQRVQAAGHDGVIAHQHEVVALVGISGGIIDVCGDIAACVPQVDAPLRRYQRGVAEVRHHHIGVLHRVGRVAGAIQRHRRVAAQNTADVNAAGHAVIVHRHIVGRQLVLRQLGEIIAGDQVENVQHRLIAVGNVPGAAQIALHGGQRPVIPLPALHAVDGGDRVIVQRGCRLPGVFIGHIAVGVVLPQIFQQRHGGIGILHLRQRVAAIGPHAQAQHQRQRQAQDQRGEQRRPPSGPEGGAYPVADDHCAPSPPDTTAPSRSSNIRSALAASAMSWVTTMTQ